MNHAALLFCGIARPTEKDVEVMSGKLCWLFPVVIAGCQTLHPACPAPPTAAAPCAPPCPQQEYHVQLPGQKVCVPRPVQQERGLPERGRQEVAKQVSAAEVLLVPRTVYVPYVQQEAVGVARVSSAQLLRRGERALETDVEEESVAETLRKLQRERDQLRREIQEMSEAMKQERMRREAAPQPCPPPVQYCPPPVQYWQPPCPPQAPPCPPQAPPEQLHLPSPRP
jgi:hypothetical protein